MAAAGIQVRHSDGREGHVFHEVEICQDKKYWFRYSTAPGRGYIGREVSGRSLTIKTEPRGK